MRTDPAKKLPELETLLAKQPAERKQTAAQQRTVMQMISARYGVPLRRVRLIRKDVDGR